MYFPRRTPSMSETATFTRLPGAARTASMICASPDVLFVAIAVPPSEGAYDTEATLTMQQNATDPVSGATRFPGCENGAGASAVCGETSWANAFWIPRRAGRPPPLDARLQSSQ